MMLILKEVYTKILRMFPVVPPEQGGIIGMKDGIVVEYLHDSSVQTEINASYTPDVPWINHCISNWNYQSIEFGGIVHSHPAEQSELSVADKKYIYNIMRSLSLLKAKLYFPIVLPQNTLIAFAVYKDRSKILIKKENIVIL